MYNFTSACQLCTAESYPKDITKPLPVPGLPDVGPERPASNLFVLPKPEIYLNKYECLASPLEGRWNDEFIPRFGFIYDVYEAADFECCVRL